MAINTNIPNVIGGEIRRLPLNENYDWTLANDIDLQAQITANDVDIANRYTKSEVDALDANLQSQVTTNKNTMDNHIASTTAHDANNIVLTSEDPYLTATDVESGLEQISARVSTIIAQSGTSSTEVVDARTSSTYGVFTTLGNRLNSSDIKLKAVEDEINTQNVGTLSLTPTTSNQTVTDSYSGVIDVEIGGATIANIFDKTKSYTNIGLGLTEVSNVFTATTGANATSSALMLLTGEIGIRKTTAGTFVQTIMTPSSLAGVTLNIGLAGNAQDAIRSYTASDLLKPSIQYTFYLKVQTLTANSMTFDLIIAEGDVASKFGIIDEALGYGLISTTEVEINTSCPQLFDKNTRNVSKSIGIDGALTTATLSDASEYIPIKPSTSYRTRGYVDLLDRYLAYYDRYKNFISVVIDVNANLTTPSNAEFCRFSMPKTDVDTIILSEGTSTPIYQSFKGSQLSVKCTNKAKFELNQLPLKQNEFLSMYGYMWTIKNNSKFTAISTDIDSLVTTGVSVDYVTIPVSKLTGSVAFNPNVAEGNSVVEGFMQRTTLPIDDASKIGKHIIDGASVVMIVAKGTYANLAAAQTALAGTEIIYQLATPVFIPFEDFPIYGIEVDGMIACNDGYTNINYSANLVPNVNLEYPRNLGASVDGLTHSIANAYDIITQTTLDLETKKQKNYIINGGFDIWQRGTTQSTNDYGSDDRWYNTNIGSTKIHSQQVFTLGQSDVPNNPIYFSRTIVTSVVGVSNYVNKTQRLENVSTLAGKTVSLSFFAKADANKNISVDFAQFFGSGGSPTIEGIGSQKIALTTSWQKITLVVAIPTVSGKTITSGNYLSCVFWFDAGSNYNARTNSLGQQSGTFDISSVCLVDGSTPQDYQAENVGDTLLKCQRYFKNLSGIYRMAYFGTDYLAFGLPSLLNEMRATPTLYSVGATESISYQVYPTTVSPIPSGFTLSLLSDNEIRATKIAHGLTDGFIGVYAKIFADAEL